MIMNGNDICIQQEKTGVESLHKFDDKIKDRTTSMPFLTSMPKARIFLTT
jgi:hypothetical protein